MVKTDANFRAIRELCGITQKVAADAIGVSVLSVKNWEYGTHAVPDKAMEWLLERAAEHDAGVEEAIRRVLSSADPGDEVRMDYYLSQEQADRDAHRSKTVNYQFLNAMTRSAAERLKSIGYMVSFTYSD